MYLTALIIDCAIARLYRHNGAMNKSVKLEPGTTEWNQTCYKDCMESFSPQTQRVQVVPTVLAGSVNVK